MDQFLRNKEGAAELAKRQSSKRVFSAEHSEYPSIAALEKISVERRRPPVLPWSRPFWLTDDLQYDLMHELGQGDFAAVYKAKERTKGKKEGRLLAVKIYKVKVKREEVDDKILDVKKEGIVMHHIRGGVSIAFSRWNFSYKLAYKTSSLTLSKLETSVT